MGEGLTRATARNIFYGGSIFFLVVFLALSGHSHWYAVTVSTPEMNEAVVRGKRVWEVNSCINCHSLLGEGAYFAPELGNVWIRYGGRDDPEGAREAIKAWMQAQPTGIEGRRQMPQFNLTEEQLNDLAEFLRWTSEINTQTWPPTEAG